MRKICELCLLLFLIALPAMGQEKNEREKRITEEDFPQNALAALKDALQEEVSIRYFLETDGDKQSYEAKFKWKKRSFSIEFDTTGVVQDVEIRISRKDVPEETVATVKRYLDENHDDWRIEKSQLHYSKIRNGKDLITRALHDHNTLIPDYELIIATKDQGKVTNYEMLFSAKGELIQKRIVINRSHDFLRF